ncbi:MAG TPA: V-type ATP synthase subunit E family protein [Candidatus Omnitrophota bacterium]|nr:V-type ATP synthase subunit E family protein [Candidatus Omnitrophota bacterium]
MADQIKELLDKIQAEGVQAAQDKAREIEKESRAKADWIVQKADAQAKKILEDAKEASDRMQASGQAALQQAARDVILSLKKEIFAMLERLIAAQVSAALTPEALSAIISSLVRAYADKSDSAVIVYLKEQDKKTLEGHFLKELQDQSRKGVELRSQDGISAGFVISFDNGKSQFDFTDREMAVYLASLLKPSIAQLLDEQKH